MWVLKTVLKIMYGEKGSGDLIHRVHTEEK
jgi:hypothetical protein